jgi:hypothetical protein
LKNTRDLVSNQNKYMIATICFAMSLVGICGLIVVKNWELKTGKKSILTSLEFHADKALAERMVRSKEAILLAVREGLRGTGLFLMDTLHDIRHSFVGFWQRSQTRMSLFLRERELPQDGKVSFFLKNVLEHKQTLRNER